MRLSRDDILKAEDLITEEVEVPEWGGSVLVRGMSGRERDDFESSMVVRAAGQMVQDFANTRAKIVARCVVGDDGQPLFTSADVTVLGEKSGAALDRVFTVASRLSGLGEKDVEELAGNFGDPNGASSSSLSLPGSAKRSRVSSPK